MRIPALLLATLAIAPAQAELLEADWLAAGDGRAVLDSATGFEWLDLTETQGLSVNQVAAQLDSTYSGWRLPSHAEVRQLFDGIAAQMNSFNTVQLLTDFRSKFGDTKPDTSDVDYGRSYGLYANEAGDGLYLGGAYQNRFNRVLRIDEGNYDPQYANSAYGVFLIKGEAAPVTDVTGPLGLGLLALAGLGLARRRCSVT